MFDHQWCGVTQLAGMKSAQKIAQMLALDLPKKSPAP
jgi:tRNA 5-methylaminomethyl-2-thiouridine biosynthesis bifunctional protein